MKRIYEDVFKLSGIRIWIFFKSCEIFFDVLNLLENFGGCFSVVQSSKSRVKMLAHFHPCTLINTRVRR